MPPPADFFALFRWVLAHKLARLAAAWVAVLALAWARWDHAFHAFDNKPRPDMTAEEKEKVRTDGNYGHTWIDFGGQWVFARTAYEGHWRELYHRDALRRTADAGFKLEKQTPAVQVFSARPDLRPSRLQPDDIKTDAQKLLDGMMGNEAEDRQQVEVPGLALVGVAGHPLAAAALYTEADSRATPVVGGPLYPPVHAIIYYPIGAIDDPLRAYHLFQLASVAMVFGCGAAVRLLSRGRVWCSVATLAILLFPGVRPGLDLGQNNVLTLLIVLWGWALAARGWPVLGGLVWGLLAFKPVWGLAFALAPLLMRNWRMLGGLAVGGCSLVLASVLLVGLDGWREWFAVGQQAAELYNIDDNWINLSRDVSGIPKRILIDMAKQRADRKDDTANLLSNLLLAFVFLSTVSVYLLRGDAQRFVATARRHGFASALWEFLKGGAPLTGTSAGFLLLGCFLCCYRFMYYDASLAAVGFAALLADPRATLYGLRGPLHAAAQPPARRRTFLFVNSAALSGLVLLMLFDNALMGLTPRATAQADQVFGSNVPDGTREKANDDGTTTTVAKTKWVPKTLSMAVDYSHAWDTLLVLAVWGWFGLRVLRDGRQADPLPPPAQPDPPAGAPDPLPAETGALPGLDHPI